MNDKLFANIIIDITHEALDKPFTYEIGEELKDIVKIGDKVVIPFGSANREIEGFVIKILSADDVNKDYGFLNGDYSKLKKIIKIAEKKISLNDTLLKMALFMSDEYGATLSQCIKTVLPIKREIRKNKKQIDVVTKYIEENKNVENIVLNEEQTKIINDFKENYLNNTYSSHLIYGVTGSGKTEVYIELINEVIKKGGNVILLIPEISLTYQTMTRLNRRFGKEVAIINSKMSDGEKYIQMKKCIDGIAKILVGPRSAIFAPFENLSLIVIDEEDDKSYKSENTPRYDAIEVAEYRAKLQNATLIRLSATPRISTFYNAKNNKGIILHTIKNRANATMATVDIIDMRKEFKYGNKTIFSKKLYEEIDNTINRGEQVLLYINRRGISKSLTCVECGFTIKCPHCDVPLTLHNDDKMKCHYCGYEIEKVDSCPNCNSKKLNSFGIGTQKLEDMVKKTFKNAKVLRMDKDTTSEKNGYENIIKKFKNKEANVLIGTQMVAKGHDFNDLTLVGIMCADMSLNIQKYDAAETAFSMFMQVSGRSGRRKEGKCIIQTYDSENFVLDLIKKSNYEDFYEKEIEFRKEFSYPPICTMMRIILKSRDEGEADLVSKDLANYIGMNFKINVLGPNKPIPSKVKDFYFRIIYIKCDNRIFAKNVREKINEFIKNKNRNVNLIFDIED